MDIFLPSRFVRDNMYGVLGQAITSDLEPADKKIRFRFRSLSYIEPSGITILSNLFEWLKKRDVHVTISYPKEYSNDKNSPIKYLDDSMFFNRYINKKLSPYAAVRPTTIPLELISYSKSYQWLPDVFMNWLANRLLVSTTSIGEIKVAIEEVFNNINDHSSENIGCIFAQHYPNMNQVKICISDFGIGIPSAIQKKHPMTDEEALLKSIEQGFSTQSTPGNRGAGLNNILSSVINVNKGTVHIHSNKGIIQCNYGENGMLITSETATGFYPGTLIEIVLNTNNIFDNEEEDFEW